MPMKPVIIRAEDPPAGLQAFLRAGPRKSIGRICGRLPPVR